MRRKKKIRIFVLDQEELSEALLKAVKGKPVKEDALTFEGEESEAYETLFQEDGCPL